MDAYAHYQDTVIGKQLTVDAIKNYLSDEDYTYLKKIFKAGQIRIWGVVESRKTAWEKIQPGDIGLFTGNKEIFAYGTICYKIHNTSLAESLWGKDKQGRPWEYIYFLSSISKTRISYEEFNAAVGYSKNYNIQGMSVLDDEKTNRFLNLFPIQDDTFLPEIKEKDYIDIITNKLRDTDDLDSKALSKHRKEQTFLRQILFKNKFTDKCAICGKEYPLEFLFCSHIKKRCLCSTEEKLDYKNIVLPMCKFGCDDLYEKGYIGVEDGQVVVIKYAQNSEVDNYINSIKGNSVDRFSSHNKKYFDQHLEINGYKSRN